MKITKGKSAQLEQPPIVWWTRPWIQFGLLPLLMASAIGGLLILGLPNPINVPVGIGATIIALYIWIWPRRENANNAGWKKYTIATLVTFGSYLGIGEWLTRIGAFSSTNPLSSITIIEVFVFAVSILSLVLTV